jgi:dipeptidyl-peptidase-3
VHARLASILIRSRAPARASILIRSSFACALLLGCTGGSRGAQKNPAPDGSALIVPIARPAIEPPFVYSAESFADLRILRYRVPSFDGLSLRQKTLLYDLQVAPQSGRDIISYQTFVHTLAVRRTLEAVVKSNVERDSDEFRGLLTYLKRVWFSNGIHHHYSSRKLVPDGMTPAGFAALVRAADAKLLPLAPGEDVSALIEKLTPIIFDPRRAAQSVNKSEGKDPVADSANHFYVNLTRSQVASYTKNQESPGDATPPSYGLNSQLVGRRDGSIEERVWRVGGMYGAALAECVRWLEKALPLAENEAQREALRQLIAFYRSGNLRDFDRYNVAWVKDTEGDIDLIHGFIETYGDAMNLRGSYEALVQVVDAAATKRVRQLSEQAAWFEQHLPVAEAFKREEVVGVNARVIEAVVAAGDSAPAMPSGVNLPNADWIRQNHGSKSVTLGNVLEAYEAAGRDNGVLEEFAASAREVTRARKHGALAQALFVDLHEVIGHASGKLREGVQEASISLGHYGSALEEARADLIALYYLIDPKLIELKLMPSYEVGRAAYDAFMRVGLLVQLARVELGQELEEAHMRNRQLIAHWALKEGSAQGVVERLTRSGKTYFEIRDYVKLRKLFGRLLTEIQRIKSEGDFESARDLVETHGVHVERELHSEVLERYRALHVAPYAGFIQPELTPVMRGEEIVDVEISYPSDFAAQQLRYSARYGFLPTYN